MCKGGGPWLCVKVEVPGCVQRWRSLVVCKGGGPWLCVKRVEVPDCVQWVEAGGPTECWWGRVLAGGTL